MSDEKQAGTEVTRAPVRVMQLLFELGKSAESLTLAALAQRLKLPKTSILSMLRALQSGGYVEHAGGAYRLSAETLKVGAVIASRSRIAPAVHAILQQLSVETVETTQYGVLATDEAVALCVDMVESPHPLRYSLSIGLRRPLYCTSIGKLILSYQSEEWVDAYFKKIRMEKFTELTVTSPAVLAALFPTIRETGVSVSYDAMIPGASGVSAAVFDADGHFVGGITIAAPTNRMLPQEARFKKLAAAAAAETSALGGYVQRYPHRALSDAPVGHGSR